MDTCIFCKIINKEIPAILVYEDENVIAFNDINPQSDTHVLIVPKKHIENIYNIDNNDYDYISNIHKASKKIAESLNIVDKGFRLITNCGEGAGQTVFHMHYHLMSGQNVAQRLI